MSKKSEQKNTTPLEVSPAEALKRMKSFAKRKEKFVAAIKESQN